MNRKRRTRQQHGFTTMQLIATIAIVSIVSAFGVLGITNARAEFRLQNSARLFASYVEKARVDAIRRHAADGQESSIETFGPGTTEYQVTMDFGSGNLETRTFELESGLVFSTAAKKVTFNWRGRITEAWVFQIFSSYLERGLPVDVSGSGDITVGAQHFPDQLIETMPIAEVGGDVDYDPSPSPSVAPPPPVEEDPGGDEIDPIDETPTPSPTPVDDGNGNGNGGDNGNGGNNGNPNASPTPTPSPTATPNADPDATPIPQCVSAFSQPTLNLSQSDPTKQSGSVTFTMTNATGVRTLSPTLLGNGNSLVMSLSLQRLDGSGSTTLTITTKNGGGNRGVFEVQIATSPSCGTPPKLTVSVSN